MVFSKGVNLRDLLITARDTSPGQCIQCPDEEKLVTWNEDLFLYQFTGPNGPVYEK